MKLTCSFDKPLAVQVIVASMPGVPTGVGTVIPDRIKNYQK